MNKQQALKMAFSNDVITQIPDTMNSIVLDFVRGDKHEKYESDDLVEKSHVLTKDESIEVYVPSDFIIMFIKAVSLTWDDFDDVTIFIDDKDYLTFTFSETLANYPEDYKNLAKHRKRQKHVTIPKSSVQ
jgi:hypothetical protein